MSKRSGGWFILGMLALAVAAISFTQKSTSVVTYSQEPPRRFLYNTAVQGPSTGVAVNDLTFVQLHMNITQVENTGKFFAVNGSQDTVCNMTGDRVEGLEISFATSLDRVSGAGKAIYEVSAGQCSDCVNDPFPQLVDGDQIPSMSGIFVALSNQNESTSFTIFALGALDPNQCFGVMSKATDSQGDGDTVRMTGGTLGLYHTVLP